MELEVCSKDKEMDIKETAFEKLQKKEGGIGTK